MPVSGPHSNSGKWQIFSLAVSEDNAVSLLLLFLMEAGLVAAEAPLVASLVRDRFLGGQVLHDSNEFEFRQSDTVGMICPIKNEPQTHPLEPAEIDTVPQIQPIWGNRPLPS